MSITPECKSVILHDMTKGKIMKRWMHTRQAALLDNEALIFLSITIYAREYSHKFLSKAYALVHIVPQHFWNIRLMSKSICDSGDPIYRLVNVDITNHFVVFWHFLLVVILSVRQLSKICADSNNRFGLRNVLKITR